MKPNFQLTCRPGQHYRHLIAGAAAACGHAAGSARRMFGRPVGHVLRAVHSGGGSMHVLPPCRRPLERCARSKGPFSLRST
jgi:hypothetical protein